MSEELNTATTGGDNLENQQDPSQQVDNGDTGLEGQTAPENDTQTQQTQQERMFRQSELDGIIKDRIARERQRFEGEMQKNPALSYLTQKAQRLGISVEQLIANDQRYEQQQELNRLLQQNIPPEYAKEMLESRQFRQKYQQTQQVLQRQQAQQKMYSEFLEAYPEAKPEDIPPEVWGAVKKGETLLSAYTRYENKKLREQLNGAQTQQKTAEANGKNAQSSPGSAKSTGKTGQFFTREQVEAMTTEEVARNLTAIKQSRKHWR